MVRYSRAAARLPGQSSSAPGRENRVPQRGADCVFQISQFTVNGGSGNLLSHQCLTLNFKLPLKVSVGGRMAHCGHRAGLTFDKIDAPGEWERFDYCHCRPQEAEGVIVQVLM